MTDICETVIAAIHTKIDAALSPATLPYEIGEVKIPKNDSPPRVVWSEVEGDIEPTKRAGGNPAEIGVWVCAWDVHVWHTTRENARLTVGNIAAGAVMSGYGPAKVRFKKPRPMHGATKSMTAKGCGFVMRCEMLVKLSEEIAATAVVTKFSGDAIAELPAGDEVVASLAFP